MIDKDKEISRVTYNGTEIPIKSEGGVTEDDNTQVIRSNGFYWRFKDASATELITLPKEDERAQKYAMGLMLFMELPFAFTCLALNPTEITYYNDTAIATMVIGARTPSYGSDKVELFIVAFQDRIVSALGMTFDGLLDFAKKEMGVTSDEEAYTLLENQFGIIPITKEEYDALRVE